MERQIREASKSDNISKKIKKKKINGAQSICDFKYLKIYKIKKKLHLKKRKIISNEIKRNHTDLHKH